MDHDISTLNHEYEYCEKRLYAFFIIAMSTGVLY